MPPGSQVFDFAQFATQLYTYCAQSPRGRNDLDQSLLMYLDRPDWGQQRRFERASGMSRYCSDRYRTAALQ
jgi:hypothetical protein